MKKNIVILYGSPRKNGNSDKLGQAFRKGALDSQCIVTEFYIRDLHINGCIGCEYCYKEFGRCSQQDDMQDIYKKLFESDVLVFVLPIYYQGFPAQVKAIVDRMFISENKQFKISSTVLLATYATPKKSMEKLTVKYFCELAKYHGWNNSGIITVAGMDEKDDIVGNIALNKAYDLGKTIGEH